MRKKRLIGLEERPQGHIMRDTDEIRVNQKGRRSRKSVGWFFCKGLKCLNFWVDYAGNEDFLAKLSDEELQWYNDFLVAYYSRTGDMFKDWPIEHKRKSYNEHKRRTQDMLNPHFSQKEFPRKVTYFSQMMEETVSLESEETIIERLYAQEIEEALDDDEKNNRREKAYIRRGKTITFRRKRQNAKKHANDSEFK